MVSLRELTEQRGNQGREGEEEGVLSVEPITMIVPPELQDVPEATASENSADSNASDNGDDHLSASSSSSSSEETPSREEGVGDVDLPAGFRFRAALHHEVADCTPSISGYKRLEEMVRAYHIPKTILLRTGEQNERACTVSRTGWIPVYADHFDAGLRFPLPGLVFDLLAEYELALTQLTPNSIRFIMGFMLLCARLEVPAKAIVFRSLFQCRLCPNSRGAKWYYLSGRDKSQLFKNGEGLIDLEALVTSEQLAVFGFVDVTNLISEASTCPEFPRAWGEQRATPANSVRRAATLSASTTQLFTPGSSSSSRPRADHRVETAAPGARRRTREETESEEDEVPLARRIRSGGTQPAQAARPTTVRSPDAPSATARASVEPASASASSSGPRIAYPEGFSYIRAECQPAMGKSLAPLADTTVRLRWDLNEEGVPVWPPSVLEDREDPARLSSFDAWVEGAPVAEQEPSSTPPNSQPAAVPSSSPVNAPASEPAARSPPARSPAAAADASMPVDLTDD
ncbi:hypothetical protein SLEP1_g3103 [Rubroshorea leprosula]|uniref:Transposase (putative) gypsy type domain-containing protein n=1 Tax=Rubroshorea leprosula TaxID=152421 RepID=A0AAV5HRM7_9ROSI|nr:hypothetical protein SLEP1_g3103 [Rubroshorea leprosula]